MKNLDLFKLNKRQMNMVHGGKMARRTTNVILVPLNMEVEQKILL